MAPPNNLLNIQLGLIKSQKLNPKLSKDKLVIPNLNSDDVKHMRIVVNNPSYNDTLILSNVLVYLDEEKDHSPVYGLHQIVNARVIAYKSDSFETNKLTVQPFIDGFQNGRSIDDLTDALSDLSTHSPDTSGHTKKYTFVFSTGQHSCDCEDNEP